MTTGNKIVTKTISEVTYIPLESVQTGLDSIPFVYKKNGTKQIVVLGESNENNIVVEQGLEPGDLIYLNTPEEPEKITKVVGTELIPVIKEKENARKEAEKRANENAQRGSGGRGGVRGQMSPEMQQQFQNMREGGQMDTAMMRRIQQMRTQQGGGQQGGQRTQGERPNNTQSQPQPAQQTQQAPVNR
jgi:hypothetical protein